MRIGSSRVERIERLELAQSVATIASFLGRIGARKPDILSQSAASQVSILSVDDYELYDDPFYC
jgi:hypothetical protein